MSLTPTQLQELQTIVLDLGEEFPHNADALWNASIRIQKAGLGPVTGAGQAAFDAAVADIKQCQDDVQPYQSKQGSFSSGFDVAVLQALPIGAQFPVGNVGEIMYLETAPNTYVAVDQIVIDPVGPNSVQMDEVGTTVFRTVPPASGGIEINNLSTGAGFERVLTTADLGGGAVPGGADTNIQFNDSGAFGGDANLVWDDVTKTLTISMLGGSGAAIIVNNTLSNTPIIQTGGSGGSTSNIPLKMFDNSGTQFFQWFFDTSLSVGNHKLELQSSSGGTVPFIEFDNSGEMSFFGAQGSNLMLFTALTGTKKVKFGQEFYQEEQASAAADIGTEGQWWTRNDAPNTPMFTDDTGVDHVLNAAGGGSPSVDTFNYQFSTSIVQTDPGAGFLRLNSATPASVTAMVISATDFDSVDLDPDMARVFRAYVITIRDPADPTRFVEYSVNAATTDAGGFWSFPLNFLAGTTIPIDNAEVSVQLRETAATGSTFVTTGTIPIYNLTTGIFDLADGDWRLTNDGATSILHSNDNLQLSSSFTLRCNQPFHQLEQAAAATNIATFGQWWVRDDVPNTPMFTDDAGNDFVLNASGGITATPTPVVNDVAVWDSTGATLSRIAGFDAIASLLSLPSGMNIQMDGGIDDKIILFGTINNASSYGSGIEASTHYFKSQTRYRWYSGQNADGGAGAIMTLEANGSLTTDNQITASVGNVISLTGDVVANGNCISGTAEGDGHWMEGGSTIYGMYLSAQSDVTFGGRPLGDTTSDLNTYFTTDNGTARGFVFKTNGTQNAAADMPFAINAVHGLLSRVPLLMLERAAALGDTAGMGQIWVLDEGFTQSLMFTNDNGNDFEIAALNLTDMNTSVLLIPSTAFVECLVFQPDVDRNYMFSAAFEVVSPAADNIDLEMVIDTNAVFKGIVQFSNASGSVTGSFALDSAVGEVITNIVLIPTDGTVSPGGTYVTITGCLNMGATSGTHSIRCAKNADTGADGRFEPTSALQASVLQVS